MVKYLLIEGDSTLTKDKYVGKTAVRRRRKATGTFIKSARLQSCTIVYGCSLFLSPKAKNNRQRTATKRKTVRLPQDGRVIAGALLKKSAQAQFRDGNL